jgi:hypothetical protein
MILAKKSQNVSLHQKMLTFKKTCAIKLSFKLKIGSSQQRFVQELSGRTIGVDFTTCSSPSKLSSKWNPSVP